VEPFPPNIKESVFIGRFVIHLRQVPPKWLIFLQRNPEWTSSDLPAVIQHEAIIRNSMEPLILWRMKGKFIE